VLAAVALLLAVSAGIAPVSAQSPYLIYQGQSFTLDGLSMQVSPTATCSEVLSTTVQGTVINCTGSSSAVYEAIAGTGTRGAAFSLATYFNNNGDFFQPITGGAIYSELKFSLIVNAATAAKISSAKLTATTTGSGGTLSITESGFPTGFTGSTLSLSAAGTASVTDATAYASPFTLNIDIKLTGPSSGSSLALTSVSMIFNPAPEPVSISIFGVSLAGLAVARRFRRKRGPTLPVAAAPFAPAIEPRA
jgi:hypothetical protein